jgi:pSer/pThr/pTyr-binding forkhead associated (FHA) protein
MKLNLMVADGVNKGKLIPITKTQFLVGRDATCHLRPASPAVSKRHCAVVVREGKVFVRDLKSTNGTIVNDQPVAGEIEVKDGDKLQIGPLNLVIRIERRAAAPAPAPAAKKPKARGQAIDEDSVADMLLEMDEEESGSEVELDEGTVPGGATLFDAPAVPTAEEEAKPEEPAKPASKYEQVKAEQAGTSAAAQEILRRYARKTR